MYEVIIITKEGCPSCLKAKAFFKSRQKKITEIPHENPVPLDLKELVGGNFKTYPRIFIKEENAINPSIYFIGGFSNLQYINFDSMFWFNIAYPLHKFRQNNPQLLGF